ncbi:hypothetical protein IQ265_05785 [Nodosilinea sp. LEGE 06152]|uniref:hypothetical protein n=1 Tax=Nodosilinea sp. LEGE 06152 TaxID=2777966 RepID=UPI00188145C6|nr:hypothetical protein [Nodosilinea sp. LEGE 06152]MBE9156341.1 hypothetical protein [Nodosilinea sp. LEGE 06152]
MVAFFSRISPAQNLHIKPDTFMLRLKQEGTLPEEVSPEEVAGAVFSATKKILPPQRNQDIRPCCSMNFGKFESGLNSLGIATSAGC